MNKLKSIALGLVAAVGVMGVAGACTPEEVAICKATPGCVEAVVQHSVEQDQLRAWAEGIQKRDAEAAAKGNHPFLVCVRNHESATAGLYTAENPYSSASGAYQFIDGTWRTVSARAGLGGYATASSAPPSVQDAVAYDTAISRGERYHWNGTGC